MPVTAKLSREFYEKLGDDATNELVDWLNQVDADYRNQLRELNELNFARFDAKVEQRFAVADANLAQRFAAYDLKLEQLVGKLDHRLAAFETRILRWMFTYWTGTMIALMAFLYTVLHTR